MIIAWLIPRHIYKSSDFSAVICGGNDSMSWFYAKPVTGLSRDTWLSKYNTFNRRIIQSNHFRNCISEQFQIKTCNWLRFPYIQLSSLHNNVSVAMMICNMMWWMKKTNLKIVHIRYAIDCDTRIMCKSGNVLSNHPLHSLPPGWCSCNFKVAICKDICLGHFPRHCINEPLIGYKNSACIQANSTRPNRWSIKIG